MPIIRTYGCGECGHIMDVVLRAEDWDAEPPECPECQRRQMRQEFKPVSVRTGMASHRARAVALAEDIASKDYGVGNMVAARREGDVPKVRYKDDTGEVQKAGWSGPSAREYQVGREALETAVALGRANRLKHGNGLDVLQSTLKSGDMPDLIENSKRLSHRIW
jgi:putative FmdB family regulatory protein